MESNDTSAAYGSYNHNKSHQQQPQLPPGFRFHPTDEELVVHYLRRKTQSAPLPISIIAEVDLYKFDPWELPEKAVFGEREWYFFSPRERKYPNGARPNRAATSGYWKATGTDKPVVSGGNQKVGVKKALVFYGGKPPKGQKTNWIMHEYRLADNTKPPNSYDHSNNKKKSLRLDDWVLCRIYKKNNAHRPVDHELEVSMERLTKMGSMLALPNPVNNNQSQSNKSSLSYMNDDRGQGICFQRMIGSSQVDPAINPSTSHLGPTLPLKRPFSSQYWGAGAEGGASSDDKNVSMIHDDYNNINVDNSSQALHQRAMLCALPDGVYMQPYHQLPGLNWYS